MAAVLDIDKASWSRREPDTAYWKYGVTVGPEATVAPPRTDGRFDKANVVQSFVEVRLATHSLGVPHSGGEARHRAPTYLPRSPMSSCVKFRRAKHGLTGNAAHQRRHKQDMSFHRPFLVRTGDKIEHRDRGKHQNVDDRRKRVEFGLDAVAQCAPGDRWHSRGCAEQIERDV
jgi:hypothetical protein